MAGCRVSIGRPPAQDGDEAFWDQRSELLSVLADPNDAGMLDLVDQHYATAQIDAQLGRP